MPKKKIKLPVKILLCLIYLIVIAILLVAAYKIYQSDKKEVSWDRVTSTKDYTYLEISKMSEAFAKIDKNKEIHFIIVEDKDEVYRSYLIAINKKDRKKYQSIIDYSYGKTEEKPKEIKVYGYPRVINKELKKLTLENYQKFIPNDNSIELTTKNFNKYFTNTYLDTTLKKSNSINIEVVILLIVVVILLILLLLTIIDRKQDKKEEVEVI